jgi:hypothetical protein
MQKATTGTMSNDDIPVDSTDPSDDFDPTHPIKLLTPAEIKHSKACNISYSRVQIFMKITNYLANLVNELPKCIAKFGNALELKCSCQSIFNDDAICCVVAVFLLDFRKRNFLAKKKTIIE